MWISYIHPSYLYKWYMLSTYSYYSNISSSEAFPDIGYTTDSEVIPRKVYYDNRTVEGKSRDVVCIIGDITDYSFGKGIVTHCELNGH